LGLTFLECSVHAFDLTIRPGVFHPGQPVRDPALSTNPVKEVFENV
jgi:hypothetical protein